MQNDQNFNQRLLGGFKSSQGMSDLIQQKLMQSKLSQQAQGGVSGPLQTAQTVQQFGNPQQQIQATQSAQKTKQERLKNIVSITAPILKNASANGDSKTVNRILLAIGKANPDLMEFLPIGGLEFNVTGKKPQKTEFITNKKTGELGILGKDDRGNLASFSGNFDGKFLETDQLTPEQKSGIFNRFSLSRGGIPIDVFAKRKQISAETSFSNFLKRKKINLDKEFVSQEKPQKLFDRLLTVKTLINELSSDRIGTKELIKSLIIKGLGGEVGVLTDRDINRVSGNPALSAKLKRFVGRNVDGIVFTDQDRNDFIEFANMVYEQTNDELENKALRFSRAKAKSLGSQFKEKLSTDDVIDVLSLNIDQIRNLKDVKVPQMEDLLIKSSTKKIESPATQEIDTNQFQANQTQIKKGGKVYLYTGGDPNVASSYKEIK